MTYLQRLAGALALAGLAFTAPAHAASSAVASASDSVSTSVETMSRSLQRSSTSSSPRPLAQGDYKVIQVAQVAPGLQDVTLQALAATAADGPQITLRVSDKVVTDGGLVVGQVVSARERPYGYEFARADTRVAFFLLLDDDWYRELQSVAVTL
jgi:hypothetical protein